MFSNCEKIKRNIQDKLSFLLEDFIFLRTLWSFSFPLLISTRGDMVSSLIGVIIDGDPIDLLSLLF